MARAAKCGTQIRVRPFASILRCNVLDIEEVNICDDEVENPVTKSEVNVVQDTSESLHDKTIKTDLFECDIELKEEHKQLLVIAVAERIQRKMPEEEIWEEIQKETGYDHRMVWIDIQRITMNKIMHLLQANDLLENIPIAMQLSTTEWLFFDRILVHKNIDVLHVNCQTETPEKLLERQKNTKCKEEPQCLQELFELVKEYNIEHLVGEELTNAWRHLTLQYNSRGRQCSPMMLQLRWYQLKRMTRLCFYKSYASSSNSDIQEALQHNVVELSVMQIAIAVAYNKIITDEYPTWETLINERRVILSEEFSRTNPSCKEKNSDQSPKPLTEPPVPHLTLDGKSTNAGDNSHVSGGIVVANEGTIIFDLKDDKEFVGLIKNIMDKETADRQAVTNEPEDNGEELKHRLLKELVNITQYTKYDRSMWPKLKKDMGPKCENVWNEMRNSTTKKVMCLLEANDLVRDISDTMQMSDSDWLLFDLVLVHEKINVVNLDSLDAQCLRELFELVMKYQVENLKGVELIEAWIHLTLRYNSRGRQCSPMMLQLRWHQLKKLSRQQVYKPFLQLGRIKINLLLAIATKYQKIITHKLNTWCTMVKQKCVALPAEFIMNLNQKGKWKVKGGDTWYLRVNNEISNVLLSDANVIISDEIKKNTLHNVLELPAAEPEIHKTKELDVIEIDSDDEINEILRQKADNLVNKVKITLVKVKKYKNIFENQLKFDAKNKTNQITKGKKMIASANAQQTPHKPVMEATIKIDESGLLDSDDEMDKRLKRKVDFMNIELPKDLKTVENIIGCTVSEFKKSNNHLVFGMEVEDSGIINKNMVQKNNHYEGFDEADFDDDNIEFVDDGIKIEEEKDCENENDKSKTATSSDNVDRYTEKSDDAVDIDLKLLMNTAVYTKKLDFMNVFKFVDYYSVKDKRVIDHAESESKPVDRNAPKDEDIESFRKQAIPGYDRHSAQCHNNVEAPIQNEKNRVKYTSWLLQKPRKRKYKSRQLSKNPDFNTQLKALSAEFLCSMRNTVLLKKCQPVTIDLHKAFENKLINGTMYLKHGNFKSTKTTEMEDNLNHEDTNKFLSIPDMFTEDEQIKLAEHIRDLIATMTADSQYDEELQTPKLPVQRSKVISLPDKDQIRLINQRLLTAEITPRHQPLLNLPTSINSNNRECNKPTTIISPLEESPNKRFKIDSKKLRPIYYCCWARKKIINFEKKLGLDTGKHMCVEHFCNCCCRLKLLQHPYLKSSPKLSEVADTMYNCINKKTSSNDFLKSKDRCTETLVRDTYSKNGGDNSSVNIPKMNAVRILNHTIDSNASCITNNVISAMTKSRHTLSKATQSREHKTHTKTAGLINMNEPQALGSPVLVLPEGVNFVQLHDDQLAVAINPGIQLEPEQLNSLLSICASVNNTPV